MTSSSSSALFLGLDLSTQSLKASLLSSNLGLVSELAINFDSDLPHYETKGGISSFQKEWTEGTVMAPVMMYVEAFDLLMDKIKQNGWELARVQGISGAGQVSFTNSFPYKIEITRFHY